MHSFDPDPTWRAVLSYCLYPKVVENFGKTARSTAISPVWAAMSSSTAWQSVRPTRSTSPTARPWSSSAWAWAEVDKDGMRTVSFELNGIRRDVQVPDEEAQKNVVQVPMADPGGQEPGGCLHPRRCQQDQQRKVGDTVEKNQTIVTIEAMKMETAITARMSGTVESVLVSEGDTVKGGQLLLTIK